MSRRKRLPLFHRVCVGLALFLGAFAAGIYFLVILPPILETLANLPR